MACNGRRSRTIGIQEAFQAASLCSRDRQRHPTPRPPNPAACLFLAQHLSSICGQPSCREPRTLPGAAAHRLHSGQDQGDIEIHMKRTATFHIQGKVAVTALPSTRLQIEI